MLSAVALTGCRVRTAHAAVRLRNEPPFAVRAQPEALQHVFSVRAFRAAFALPHPLRVFLGERSTGRVLPGLTARLIGLLLSGSNERRNHFQGRGIWHGAKNLAAWPNARKSDLRSEINKGAAMKYRKGSAVYAKCFIYDTDLDGRQRRAARLGDRGCIEYVGRDNVPFVRFERTGRGIDCQDAEIEVSGE